MEDIVARLKQHLQTRIKNRTKLLQDVTTKVGNVRHNIEDLEKQNVFLSHENRSLKALYDVSLKRIKSLESMLVNAEAANESMQKKFTDYKSLTDNYYAALDERDMAKSQGQLEKQRIKTRYKAKIECEREKLAQEMNAKFEEQKTHLKNQMYETQVKALQKMLGTTDNSQVITQETPARKKSDPKINSQNVRGRQENRTNLRHRRSRSQGATSSWIDHCPDKVRN